MCGLFGAFGNFRKRSAAMTILCMNNAERGTDSTGIAVDGAIYKDKENPYAFAKRKRFREMTRNGKVVIGHTRFATHGAVTKENAHPFIIDNEIVGAHNGVVSNLEELKTVIAQQYEVDSQYLLALRNLMGDTRFARGALNLSFQHLVGEDKGKLFLQRHSNPLYLATIESDEGPAYMYSSIESGLKMALGLLDLNGSITMLDDYSETVISEEGVFTQKYEVPYDSRNVYDWQGGSYGHDAHKRVTVKRK